MLNDNSDGEHNRAEDDFEELVAGAIDSLPEHIKDRMCNVAVVIDDRPPDPACHGRLLLGLYQGVPLTKRGVYYSSLPDKITIYKESVIKVAEGRPDKIKQIVADTVWHEVAHHFGMNEKEVRDREKKRKENF